MFVHSIKGLINPQQQKYHPLFLKQPKKKNHPNKMNTKNLPSPSLFLIILLYLPYLNYLGNNIIPNNSNQLDIHLLALNFFFRSVEYCEFGKKILNTMAEDLKLIVTETNKCLETDYNLISFDSLAPDSLLQILVNILEKFNALRSFEIRGNDPDENVRKMLEGLRNIQYRPSPNDANDPGTFRRNLMHGEKKCVYPILRWIFDNKDRIHQVAYLAKYLIPLKLPPDAMANSEISNLYTQYEMAMDQFKEAHKEQQAAAQEGNKMRELKNDIDAIETETENVKKRIERTQARLDKVPQQELFLEAAHNLRVEKERQKELQIQMDEQKQGLQRATQIQDRLQKELHSARMATQGTTPEHLMEGIIEETQVLEFMVQQKLPQEVITKQSELQILQEVLNEPTITREYLLELQLKLDGISKEVQTMVESRMAERDTQNDSLAPFRQQAAMVARNKEMAAEQLNQATKELREVDESLNVKQSKLQETIGEVILRGDELKQYVNTLRAKSSVYKQQRAELAALKIESADLSQTLDNLKSQDPSLSATLKEAEQDGMPSMDQNLSRPESPIENRGMAELTRIVDGLQRAVEAARNRVTPLSQQLRHFRERVADLADDRDSKKQVRRWISYMVT